MKELRGIFAPEGYEDQARNFIENMGVKVMSETYLDAEKTGKYAPDIDGACYMLLINVYPSQFEEICAAW